MLLPHVIVRTRLTYPTLALMNCSSHLIASIFVFFPFDDSTSSRGNLFFFRPLFEHEPGEKLLKPMLNRLARAALFTGGANKPPDSTHVLPMVRALTPSQLPARAF